MAWRQQALGVDGQRGRGVKYDGQTPAGTYRRTGGCDTTSALEVEEVPA
jgi:hypothetical protein